MNAVGFDWPRGDEDKLFEMGQAWVRFADRLRGGTDAVTAHAQNVWQLNVSDTTAAFEQAWTAADSPVSNLHDAATTVELVGVGLMVCAGIVLALKLSIVTQLIIMIVQIAQAIATAVATAGASLLEIPVFRAITKFILDRLQDMAIAKVLG
jgi:hypothetical protein